MRLRVFPSFSTLARRIALLAALPGATLLAAGGCDRGGRTLEPTEPQYDASWLHANAHVFASVQPGGSTADLAPLRQMIGNARLVGLGEATHGTREFFTMKHRIVELLVKELGFTVFGIEATYAEANRVNAYVNGGPGDARVLLSNLYFWTWNTQEVLDLIEWMRAHNQSGAQPRVQFYGFDMQYSRVAMDDVETFVARVDPARVESVRAQYACYRDFQDEIGRPLPEYRAAPFDVRQRCRDGVRGVHADLEARAAEYTAASSPDEYALALRAAAVVVQNEAARNQPEDFRLREVGMAENASWLLDRAGPGGRAVLWAHNLHVSTLVDWMGELLRQRHGSDYVTIGFTFDRGGFNAVGQNAAGDFTGLAAHAVSPAPADTYDAQFDRVGGRLYVDLRPLRVNPPAPAAWLVGPLPTRQIGAVYNASQPSRYFQMLRLPDAFDIVIHIGATTPSVLLPFIRD